MKGSSLGAHINDPHWTIDPDYRSELIFWVNPAEDSEVRIDLEPDTIDDDIHTVLLNNSVSSVLRNAATVFEVLTPGLLEYGVLQPFWLSWVGNPGSIAFGKSNVTGEDQIAEYFSDAIFTCQGHTISTMGPSTISNFVLDETYGN